MGERRYIQNLADELLDEILSFLLKSGWRGNESSHGKPHGFSDHSNGFLAPRYGEKTDLDRFRLVCKRFKRLSTPRKFPRFVLRFSKDGFRRLEDLLNMQLACYVKYFTYMVRPFYNAGNGPHTTHATNGDQFPISLLRRRVQDQNFIVETGCDLALLRRAMMAFSSLQQVKLLRLQDEVDERIIRYIQHRHLQETSYQDWTPACSRAVSNLSVALLESSCTAIRFIGPQISPDASLRLLQTPSTTLAAMGSRLTSLEINFHSKTDLTARRRSLSPVLHTFFVATSKNLTTLHLGFPSKLPLNHPLEQIFHRIHWKRLRALGIQGWRLHSDELITLLRRHRRQLTDLRLLNIYLRDGSKWRDVLTVLHDDMEQLESLGLREIDYASHFDTESDDTTPIQADVDTGSTSESRNQNHNQLQPLVPDDILPFSTRLPPHRTCVTMSRDKLRQVSVDQLGDDGVVVRPEQIPLWEAWVLGAVAGRGDDRRRVVG